MGSSPVSATYTSDIASVLSKEFLDIEGTTGCGFILINVRDIIRIYNQMHCADKHPQHCPIIWPVWLNAWVLVYEQSDFRFKSCCSHFKFRHCTCFEKGVAWHSCNQGMRIHSETRICMIKTYGQKHGTDKYSQHSSIIWPVWLNGWAFIYELSSCVFEFCCSYLNPRISACLEQGVSWYSFNYKVWIHPETRRWLDKKIQSNTPYR